MTAIDGMTRQAARRGGANNVPLESIRYTP